VVGYFSAVVGLRAQADAAIGVHAHPAVDGVDTWSASRLDDLKSLTTDLAFRAALESSGDTRGLALGQSKEVQTAFDEQAKKLDSIGPLHAKGDFISASSTDNQSVAQRDSYQASIKGSDFTTAISTTTATDRPAICHSVRVRSRDGKVIGAIRSRRGLDVLERVHAPAI
jgi:hypothetical protein